MRASKNNRNDTVSDVRMFLEREQPERLRTVEVVCSSARRDMDRRAVHVPYRLFCETLRLFPECVTDNAATTRATGWPQSTKIACWHDCHPFDTMPIPIPKYSKHDISTSSPTYVVYGVFCSCNCAIAYILERGTYDQQQQLLRFKQMVITVFGIDADSVFAMEPAAPRIFLTMFGGHLSIDEFRSQSLLARCTLLTPPFISYSMVLEENARGQQQQHNGAILLPVKQSTHVGTGGGGSGGGGSGGGGSGGGVTGVGGGVVAEEKVPDISPITTHTIRGLRRPTLAASALQDEDDEAPRPPSSFEQFVRTKQADAKVNSDGEEDVHMEEKEVKPRRTATPRRGNGAKKSTAGSGSAAASGAAAASSGGKNGGTLAVYLQQ